jgi:hypothetical protein
MYISHHHVKERKGFLVEARIMLATHLVALDSFVAELHYSPKRQLIREVSFHPQLAATGFVLKSVVDKKAKNITLSCSGEVGFVTGSTPVELARVVFFAVSPKSELRFGNKTNIKIHEGKAVEVITPEQQPTRKKLVLSR